MGRREEVGREEWEGAFPVLRILKPAKSCFSFYAFKCIVKCIELSSKPSSCCLATAIESEVPFLLSGDSSPDLRKLAGGVKGFWPHGTKALSCG